MQHNSNLKFPWELTVELGQMMASIALDFRIKLRSALSHQEDKYRVSHMVTGSSILSENVKIHLYSLLLDH